MRGKLGKVAAVSFQGFISNFRILRRNALVAANFLECAHEAIARDSKLLKDAAGRAGILSHRKHQVLDRDVFIFQFFGFVFCFD